MKILSIRPKQAEMARSLLVPEVIAAIKKGLPVTALVAVENGRAVGAIGGAADGNIFTIMSVFVNDDHRHKGIGRALVAKLEQIVEPLGLLIRAEYTRERSDHNSLQGFFLRCGYREDIRPIPGYYIGYVRDLIDEERHAMLPEACAALPFSEISEKCIREADERFMHHGAYLPEGGLASSEIVKDISYAVLFEEAIRAYIALEQPAEDMLTVESVSSDTKDSRIITGVVKAAARKIKSTYSPDTKIAMEIFDKEQDRIFQLMIRDAKASSFTFIK